VGQQCSTFSRSGSQHEGTEIMLILALLLGGAAQAEAVAADPPDARPVTATVTARPETATAADPVICKVEQRTNSRFGSRVCQRKSERNARAQADRDAASEMIDRPAVNPPSNGS
jgi:hypothetical protein